MFGSHTSLLVSHIGPLHVFREISGVVCLEVLTFFPSCSDPNIDFFSLVASLRSALCPRYLDFVIFSILFLIS